MEKKEKYPHPVVGDVVHSDEPIIAEQDDGIINEQEDETDNRITGLPSYPIKGIKY